MDTIINLGNMFWIGWAVGVMTLPVLRYTLNRFGGPVWEAAKKIGYNVWEDMKSIFKRGK